MGRSSHGEEMPHLCRREEVSRQCRISLRKTFNLGGGASSEELVDREVGQEEQRDIVDGVWMSSWVPK